MTTTDMTTPIQPSSPPPTRRLRRSRTDRIGAGVAGGLGEYFGIDPVIFRVLFATAAFFGGAGVLAYLLAWAAIPEEGTERAAIDGWVTSLRARRVPVWLIAAGAAVLLWLVAFSWWAPGPFFPVLAVVIILVVVFGRRGSRETPLPPAEPVRTAGDARVSLTKSEQRPAWSGDARQWIAESRAARRERVRRAFPVKVATLLVLGATLLTLGLIDAATGIALPLYFWFALAILSAGLVVGMVLRRTPWSLTLLLVPAIFGVLAFAGSHSSLHDGVGERTWTPSHSLASSYKLSLGQSTLDLRSLEPQNGPRTIRIEQAAGQVHIIAPKSMNLTVHASVHFGVVTLDGQADQSGGVAVSRLVEPLPGATGAPITVDVHLTDGQVTIDRQ